MLGITQNLSRTVEPQTATDPALPRPRPSPGSPAPLLPPPIGPVFFLFFNASATSPRADVDLRSVRKPVSVRARQLGCASDASARSRAHLQEQSAPTAAARPPRFFPGPPSPASQKPFRAAPHWTFSRRRNIANGSHDNRSEYTRAPAHKTRSVVVHTREPTTLQILRFSWIHDRNRSTPWTSSRKRQSAPTAAAAPAPTAAAPAISTGAAAATLTFHLLPVSVAICSNARTMRLLRAAKCRLYTYFISSPSPTADGE